LASLPPFSPHEKAHFSLLEAGKAR